MSYSKTQSAIRETADQLFVDTADGVRLNVVGNNLGVTRPLFGYADDDKFRAAIKKLVFEKKNVKLIFNNILELCIGPRKTRVSDFAEAALIGDKRIKVNDASVFTLYGTLVLDKGTAAEEEVDFVFVDQKNNYIYLKDPLTKDHNTILSPDTDYPYGSAEDYPQAGPFLSGVNSLTVAGYIPTSYTSGTGESTLPKNTPYTVLITDGINEEFNITDTVINNVVTLLNNTAAEYQQCTRSGYAVDVLGIVESSGYHVGTIANIDAFKKEGWALLSNQDSLANDPMIVYYDKDIDNGILRLRHVSVAGTFSTGYMLEPVEITTKIKTATVAQIGKGWELFEVDSGELYIYLPYEPQRSSLRHASYLHGNFDESSIVNTTLSADFNVDDMSMLVLDVSTFPETGMVDVAGTVYSYVKVSNTELAIPRPNTVFAGLGALVKYAASPEYAATELDDGNMYDTNPPGGLLLNNAFFGHYVHEGAFKDACSSVQTTLSSGEGTGTRKRPIPGTVKLVADAVNTQKCLEVEDLSYWQKTPTNLNIDINTDGATYEQKTVSKTFSRYGIVTGLSTSATGIGDVLIDCYDTSEFPTANFPYYVSIGRDGSPEVATVTGNNTATNQLTVNPVLTQDHDTNDRVYICTSTGVGTGCVVTAAPTANTITVTDARFLPEGTAFLGYSVVIDKGNANEETLVVKSNTGGTITFTTDAVITHIAGESVELVNDVILLTNGITYDHFTGESASPLVNSILLASGTGFSSTDGKAILNYGNNYVKTRMKIESINYPGGGGDVYVTTDGNHATLPTVVANNPYYVRVNPGTTYEEYIPVRDFIAPDQLGLEYRPFTSPALSSYIEFIPAEEEVFDYDTKSGAVLSFTNGNKFKSGHFPTVTVTYSDSVSETNRDGNAYPTLLPADPGVCTRDFISYAKAAGIEVTIKEKK